MRTPKTPVTLDEFFIEFYELEPVGPSRSDVIAYAYQLIRGVKERSATAAIRRAIEGGILVKAGRDIDGNNLYAPIGWEQMK